MSSINSENDNNNQKPK